MLKLARKRREGESLIHLVNPAKENREEDRVELVSPRELEVIAGLYGRLARRRVFPGEEQPASPSRSDKIVNLAILDRAMDTSIKGLIGSPQCPGVNTTIEVNTVIRKAAKDDLYVRLEEGIRDNGDGLSRQLANKLKGVTQHFTRER